MANLKKRNFVFVLIGFVLSSCQNGKVFEMNDSNGKELYVVEIDSNRIIHECYFVNAEKENKWRHQYFMYLLTDKNEVIPVMNPTNQDKHNCSIHLKKVERVLRKEPKVRLCVRETLKRIVDDGKTIYTPNDFGPLGIHKDTYHALTFDTICNSKDCYSTSDTWTYTCPEFQKQKGP